MPWYSWKIAHLLYFFQLQNDPKFEEFLEAHLKGGKKQIWSNDVTDKVTKKTTGDGKDSDADEGDKSDSGVEGSDKNTIDHYVNYVFLFLGETYCFHPVCHKGLSGSDRMVVAFTTFYAISHNWSCEFESHSGEVFPIQHYVIKFVSDLQQVDGLLRVLRFLPPIKLAAMI